VHGRDRDAAQRKRLVQRLSADMQRIDERDALRTVGDVERTIQVVQEYANDLAESERDDRQVVPSQLERRCAQQHAEKRGDERGQRQQHRERQVYAELRRCEQRVTVSADSEERDIAEVE
jgi:hypothetical protein